MRKGNRIIVGDAPGIDRQVQDYLNAKKYKNVEIYGPGKQVRYSANSKWKTNPIDDPDHEPGSKEWLAKKDIAMTEAADEGLAIVLDEGAKATRKNVQRLSDSGKSVKVYSLNRDGSDSWEDDRDRDTYSQKSMADYARTLFNTRFAKGNPEKYLSNVYKDRDNPINKMQQAELRGFLKNVPMSKHFKELQAEFDRLDKESSELDLAYLEGRGDLKSYKKSLANLSKTYDQQKDEVCRMLGADPSKLESIDKSQLTEDFKEAHSIGEYANKTHDSKPQKKSISNRINSLMDRVFGNSIKAQEKGQQKVSVNYEPVTSEKAKTKRGETYEINDWNGDAQDTIKAFKSNPEPHINVARKAALQEARRIIGWYAKDNPEAQRFLNMSDQQLSKRIGLDFVSAYSHGTVEFSFGDAGTGDFLGHEVDVEYDLNRRKVMNVSVNG